MFQVCLKQSSLCRIPEASPREPTRDGQTAQDSQGAADQAAAEQAPNDQAIHSEPETASRGSVSSWPRSIANADGRPSLFSAFPSAGQPGRSVRLSPSTDILAERDLEELASGSSWPEVTSH